MLQPAVGTYQHISNNVPLKCTATTIITEKGAGAPRTGRRLDGHAMLTEAVSDGV